jgi:heptosyltransferase-2
MRALIIETAFLGDVIVSLGLAREIKRLYPDAFVVYLVRPESVAIVRQCPDVDEVIPFDKYGSESGRKGVADKAAQLNQLQYDTVFALHKSKRTQMLVSALRATTKVGYTGESLTHVVPDSGWDNRYERAILPLKAIDQSADVTALPRLDCGEHEAAREFASRFEHTVALAPGSVWKTKQWGDDKFAALAGLIRAAGYGIIVIGDSASQGAANRICEVANESNVFDLTGRATLEESASAIASASLLVSNDSAPSHLAIAVGTPVLTIFGPTVPEFGFAPPSGRGEAIETQNLWCRPCASHGSNVCPIYTHDCMNLISPATVFERVKARLSFVSIGAIPKAMTLS